MSRVIKAVQARFVDDSGKPETKPGEAENNTEELIEQARAECEQEFQTAYAELVAAAQEEVSLLLEDARSEAQSIIDKARAEAGEMRRRAYETGLAEGYERAENETMAVLEKAKNETEAVLAKAEAERQRIITEAEPGLFKLSLEIAEKILKYELDQGNEAYMSILSGALSRIKTEGPVTIHVNSSEYIRYFGGRDKAKLRSESGVVNADILMDPSVEPYGCLIETESGIVDAGITTQLEQVARAIGLEE